MAEERKDPFLSQDKPQPHQTVQALRTIWEAWKRIGRFIGDATARVILTLFYFTIFAPYGLGVRIWSDPLRLARRDEVSFWMKRGPRDVSLREARKGF